MEQKFSKPELDVLRHLTGLSPWTQPNYLGQCKYYRDYLVKLVEDLNYEDIYLTLGQFSDEAIQQFQDNLEDRLNIQTPQQIADIYFSMEGSFMAGFEP